MGTEIRFKTVKAGAGFGRGKGDCLGRIIHNKTLSMDEIAADYAKYARLDEDEARFQAARFAGYIVKAVGEGKRLNFDAFWLYLSMKGKIDGANGRFDPQRNKIELNIAIREPLEKALAQLEPVNATMDDGSLVITSVLDDAIKEEGRISHGATVYIAGHTFLIDPARPDEGVWLEGDDGSKVAKARIIASTATTLDCAFDDPAPAGRYRIAVYTRMGNAERPTPAVARRRVAVVA